MHYAIRFDFPDGGPVMYAGEYKGGLGWAPQLATAIIWNNPETPARILKNGYGGAHEEIGTIIEVADDVARAIHEGATQA